MNSAAKEIDAKHPSSWKVQAIILLLGAAVTLFKKALQAMVNKAETKPGDNQAPLDDNTFQLLQQEFDMQE